MPTLDERQERLKQLQTFLDTTDDDARAEASLLHRRRARPWRATKGGWRMGLSAERGA